MLSAADLLSELMKLEKLLKVINPSHILQICSRQLWKYIGENVKNLYKTGYLINTVENIVAKGEIAHYGKYMAAKESENVVTG